MNQKLLEKTKRSDEEEKERTLLSFKGEKKASLLKKEEDLQNVTAIYSSNYMSAIGTAKYISEEFDLPIFIDERLKERKTGILGVNNERFLKETQEHDFDYKLHNGESLNMVQERMKNCLKDILFHQEDQTVAIFTHDMATEALLSIWCEKGYNLENQMILNYKDRVIMDGAYHPMRTFQLIFEQDKLKDLLWKNEKEL